MTYRAGRELIVDQNSLTIQNFHVMMSIGSDDGYN